ncbi:MAG: FAD-binding oxidoreductase [Euryarchaeota archaeon]|nr:FAD-binding oxidoreductase [Euryarchaeota archaeon]
MATSDQHDPATDSRANYDYRGNEIERPDLVSALDARVKGDVRFDEYSRQLYATDASAYEVTPIGVVFPRSTGDVAAVMSYCSEREIPVLPRGGGTSLAGQAVNEAVVLDFTRHMTAITDVDLDAFSTVPHARAILTLTRGEETSRRVSKCRFESTDGPSAIQARLPTFRPAALDQGDRSRRADSRLAQHQRAMEVSALATVPQRLRLPQEHVGHCPGRGPYAGLPG